MASGPWSKIGICNLNILDFILYKGECDTRGGKFGRYVDVRCKEYGRGWGIGMVSIYECCVTIR